MAWFSGRVSLGNFPDLAGAVNKISESVKNIEKNFDNALGFEEKPSESSSNEGSGIWPAAPDTKALFNPVMALMGQRGDESPSDPPSQSGSPSHLSKTEEPKGETPELLSKVEEEKGDSRQYRSKDEKESGSPGHPSKVEEKEEVEQDRLPDGSVEKLSHVEEKTEDFKLERDAEVPFTESVTQRDSVAPDTEEMESESSPSAAEQQAHSVEVAAEVSDEQPNGSLELGPSESSPTLEAESSDTKADQVERPSSVSDESHTDVHVHDEDATLGEEKVENEPPDEPETADGIAAESEPSVSPMASTEVTGTAQMTETIAEVSSGRSSSAAALEDLSEKVSHEIDRVEKTVEVIQQSAENDAGTKEHSMPSISNSDSPDVVLELGKVKKEMKMMETALQGAARQAQAKADEIAKLMNENEQLKSIIEDLKRKSNDAELESLREEYHQRVAALERKVYALTKERDTLRREQSKKSDAAALLKEKDEIINQVMAEGEELSKKQAAQESTIRKLRAQIRELEEEKKGLTTKLQVEENKVESIKRDKAATEKLLQETIEKHQTELLAQKEYYTSALTAAKEAEALAEARVNSEARTELESRLREAEEREAMLVQTLQELRQTLSRKEQQAVFNEDKLRWEIEDLQKRYQESERRCEELISQVPESTRPLLRQIEAIQEAASRKAEAWAAVERSLNSRLQEAEAKAAAAEERERSINDRLSQTLSRVNVLEAQISCLRAEQTQLSRSLEKERQRAAENRQEYLAAKEEADTQEGRANQLDEELKELKRKHKQELQEALMHRELLQQEIEREKAARLELEKTAHVPSTAASDQTTKHGDLTRKLSSTSSLGSIEESYFLQASLNSSESLSERRSPSVGNMSPFYMKSMTPSAFEATLRQKEGELASYMSRLASMESIRDSLAEELVKMTAQCEKLKSEASLVPGIRAELEALRRRHSAALELMGERDEELEELRADIVDLKEMYREQVNLLVNQIQTMSSSMGSS